MPSSIHPSSSPPVHPSLLPLTPSLSVSSLQERSDHSPQAPCSTFYLQIEPEPRHFQPPGAAPARPQPHAGHSSPGQLPGSAPLEAERGRARDGAPPFSALPPVAAGDGALFKVMEKNQSPWQRRRRVAFDSPTHAILFDD